MTYVKTMIQLTNGAVELLEIPGDASRPPLVLLHEGLGSVGLWRSFPAELAGVSGARIVAFSRFGHGGSDPPPRPRTSRFMHEEAHQVLPELLGTLGISDPILVGHSDGASIALIHASAHPVRGVVAMAPHVFVEEVGLAEIRRARAAFSAGDLRERMARHHRDPDEAFGGWNDVWLDPEFERWNLLEEVSRITCPLMLIQGGRDQYGTSAQLDAIERAAPSAAITRLELPQARHAPHLDAPQETLAAIAAFAARPPTPR